MAIRLPGEVLRGEAKANWAAAEEKVGGVAILTDPDRRFRELKPSAMGLDRLSP